MRIAYMLRRLSHLLIIVAAGLFLFDFVYYWVFEMKIKIRNVGELCSAVSKPGFEKTQAIMKAVIPPQAWDSFVHLPAPAVIAILAALCYAVFRFLLFLGDEKRSQRL